MNLHKIAGVDLDVCSYEQKIAYNLACAYGLIYRDEPSRVEILIALFCAGHPEHRAEFNLDAVRSALNNGLDKYFSTGLHQRETYEQIGKIFAI